MNILVILIVVGVIFALFPMDAKIKQYIYILLAVLVLLAVLQLLGVSLPYLGTTRLN